jgi:hypothetical protein
MRRAAVPVALTALTGLAACPAPEETIPLIHVDPRAAARIALFASSSHAPERQTAVARAHPFGDGDAIGGPKAMAAAGDVVLENAEVVFVVGGPTGDTRFPRCGALLDAADAKLRKDELAYFIPSRLRSSTWPAYATLATGADADGSAWVEARGPDLTTRYTLHAPDRALLVETTFKNTKEAREVVALAGDTVDWGSATRVAPGKEPGFEGESRGAYVGAVGRLASYALTSTEGTIRGGSTGSSTVTFAPQDVVVEPGGTASFTRVFVVGARADTSSLIGELAMAAGQPVGEVKIAAGSPPAGVELVPDGSDEALTMVAPFEGVLPVGRYRVARPGHAAEARDAGSAAFFDVRAGASVEVTVPAL